MHYRWWPLPSRYFRKEPEILADAPQHLVPSARPTPPYGKVVPFGPPAG